MDDVEPTITRKILDRLTYEVIGGAIEVHKALGPGLLESVYHERLKYELSLRKISFQRELPVPVSFKGAKIATV